MLPPPAEVSKPEEAPPYEPLVDKAIELWSTLNRRRDPHPYRSAFLPFYYPENYPEEENPLARVFDGLMKRYVEDPTPKIPRTRDFLVALCINPNYRKLGRDLPDPLASPISFQMTFWGPVPPQLTGENSPVIMKIIEVPIASPTSLLIFGEGIKPTHASCFRYDLSDIDEPTEEPTWGEWYVSEKDIHDLPKLNPSKYFLHVPTGNMQFKRDFVSAVLDRLQKVALSGDRLDLSLTQIPLQEENARGLLEMGSIAFDLNRHRDYAKALHCLAGYIYY